MKAKKILISFLLITSLQGVSLKASDTSSNDEFSKNRDEIPTQNPKQSFINSLFSTVTSWLTDTTNTAEKPIDAQDPLGNLWMHRVCMKVGAWNHKATLLTLIQRGHILEFIQKNEARAIRWFGQAVEQAIKENDLETLFTLTATVESHRSDRFDIAEPDKQAAMRFIADQRDKQIRHTTEAVCSGRAKTNRYEKMLQQISASATTAFSDTLELEHLKSPRTFTRTQVFSLIEKKK